MEKNGNLLAYVISKPGANWLQEKLSPAESKWCHRSLPLSLPCLSLPCFLLRSSHHVLDTIVSRTLGKQGLCSVFGRLFLRASVRHSRTCLLLVGSRACLQSDRHAHAARPEMQPRFGSVRWGKGSRACPIETTENGFPVENGVVSVLLLDVGPVKTHVHGQAHGKGNKGWVWEVQCPCCFSCSFIHLFTEPVLIVSCVPGLGVNQSQPLVRKACREEKWTSSWLHHKVGWVLAQWDLLPEWKDGSILESLIIQFILNVGKWGKSYDLLYGCWKDIWLNYTRVPDFCGSLLITWAHTQCQCHCQWW